MAHEPVPDGTDPSPRTVAVALASFWGIFVLLNTARALALGFPHPGGALIRRVFVALVGAALAWTMYRLIFRLRRSSPRVRLIAVATASLPASFLFATTNFLVFDLLAPLPGETCASGRACTIADAAVSITETLINWSFVFAAWGLLYLAMSSAARMRAADRRAGAYREAARLAEIRALRYQVNPHFLFNVLNSLGALVRRKDTADAEGLIEEVGRFFRHSLSVDPVADVALEEEVEVQLRYLAIERRRFPDRMTLSIDLAEGAKSALVPALILQPLIENAVKHGVGRATGQVEVAIRGYISNGALHVLVEDDAQTPRDGQDDAKGLGVGLGNVADRLEARFGHEARLVAGPRESAGYRAEIIIPAAAR